MITYQTSRKPRDEELEREKYEQAWRLKDREYAVFSPGLFISDHIKFLDFFKTNHVQTVLDAGIGSGKLFKKMKALGFICHGVDISENCLDKDLLPFKDDILTVGTLWDGTLFEEERFDAIVCTDVLEHIPTEYVSDVLLSFHKWCRRFLFLQISLTEDIFSTKVGSPLHLTVKPKEWWDKQVGLFKTIHYKTILDRNGNEMWATYLLAK